MFDNELTQLAAQCIWRVRIPDHLAQLALFAALVGGIAAAGLTAWKTWREVAALKPGEGRSRTVTLPGGFEALIDTMVSAPAWIGLFAGGRQKSPNVELVQLSPNRMS